MRILALLAVVAIATAMMAPVIADSRAKAGVQSCGIAKKLDPRTKICVWRF